MWGGETTGGQETGGCWQSQPGGVLCACSAAQSCLILCNPMDCSPPGSSVHGISQARILEWVANSFSRESSQPRDWTHVSCIAGRFFTLWALSEAWQGPLLGGRGHASCPPAAEIWDPPSPAGGQPVWRVQELDKRSYCLLMPQAEMELSAPCLFPHILLHIVKASWQCLLVTSSHRQAVFQA